MYGEIYLYSKDLDWHKACERTHGRTSHGRSPLSLFPPYRRTYRSPCANTRLGGLGVVFLCVCLRGFCAIWRPVAPDPAIRAGRAVTVRAEYFRCRSGRWDADEPMIAKFFFMNIRQAGAPREFPLSKRHLIFSFVAFIS